jgi:hypothetical protein
VHESDVTLRAFDRRGNLDKPQGVCGC